MKAFRKILAACAALILCLSLSLSAAASDVEPAPVPAPAAEPGIDFEGKSWDDVMDALLEKHNTSRYSVSAAYINLATGEEHYINPDTFSPAGAMYLLPLNMHFADTKLGGTEQWKTAHPDYDFELLRDSTLVNADETQAQLLCELLGGYNEFRTKTAEYMGSTAPDSSLFADKQYSVNDFAQCLKLLHNEAERFPGIKDALLKAAPGEAFKLHELGVDALHRPGELNTETDAYVHDCGIIYGTEPIALVMMTRNVDNAMQLLGAYSSLMLDYAEHVRTLPEETPQPTEAPVQIIESPAEPEPQVEKKFPFVAVAAVLIFAVVSLVLLISLCVKYKLRFFWLLMALIVSVAAMGLSILGMHTGTVYAKPSGDPAESADKFLSSICSGSYQDAYVLLRDYADLGLETVPSTEAGKLAYEALHKSFSYELKGQCSINKLEASQPYSFTYLDLSCMEEAVVTETPNQLRKIVAARPMNQIYDENRNFLPEVTEEAYLNAIRVVLEKPETYYRSIELSLSLSYSDGRWQVLASPALLKALNGGTAY